MNFLGIDYGLSHVGVSFSDGSLASPLTTIKTADFKSNLSRLIDDYRIGAVIVGLPDGILHDTISELVDSLAKTYQDKQVIFYLADETLSSFDAKNNLIFAKKSLRKSKEHSAAATIILQNWLDSHPASV